ncbi:MAG: hypothetical protein AAF098_11725 [Pseudomonadota bacterium]
MNALKQTSVLCLILMLSVTTEDLLAQSGESTESKAPELEDHSHLPIPVPEGTAAPNLSLRLDRDSMSGFNLHLDLANFLMQAPPSELAMREMMSAHFDLESGYLVGHAHLYINGEKIQRLYGNSVHIPAALLKSGINQLSVSLNNHGHLYWTKDERQILATLFINPARGQALVYRFESFPVTGTDSAIAAGSDRNRTTPSLITKAP